MFHEVSVCISRYLVVVAIMITSFSCASAKGISIDWYDVARWDPNGLHIAVSNEGRDPVKIEKLQVNNRWDYSGPELPVLASGEFRLIPFEMFQSDRGERLSEECILPVLVTGSMNGGKPFEVKNIASTPSSIPPAFNKCVHPKRKD